VAGPTLEAARDRASRSGRSRPRYERQLDVLGDGWRHGCGLEDEPIL
jgi:hypothetical protein